MPPMTLRPGPVEGPFVPSPRNNSAAAAPRRCRGFTLLEILVVLLIVSAALLWVAPRLASFQVRDMPWTARHLSGWIRYVADEASMTHRTFRLHYQIDAGRYWTTVLSETGEETATTDTLMRQQTLPDGIAFDDVVTAGRGKVSVGETVTEVAPFGLEKTWIHLRAAGEQWSLSVHPLTGRVTVFDRYVDETTH